MSENLQLGIEIGKIQSDVAELKSAVAALTGKAQSNGVKPLENPGNDNPGLIQNARLWQQSSEPSVAPPGSWILTSRNVIVGKREGAPWLYAELRRTNNESLWHAILQAVDLNGDYWNDDGYLKNAH
jgi:hypothetical protein